MSLVLHRSRELRAIERDAARDLPPGTLMQRAGEAAAAWIARRFPLAADIVVVCGPGNNGGDGYVCAQALHTAGRAVRCLALADPATDDARAAAAAWRAAGGSTTAWIGPDLACDLAIDALFGIGLARPLEDAALEAARWLGSGPHRCVALDVPSGLDADTGAWVGGVAGVRADATVTFLAAKPGLFTGDGVDACGEIAVDPLGLPATPGRAALIDPAAFAAVLRPRRRNSHKGRFGSVLVTGGAPGMVGAALLAARAALRLGAGRVYVDLVGATVACDPLAPELMFRRPSDDDTTQCVGVVGCGLGDGDLARAALAAALASAAACVIDADGLNLLAVDAGLRRQLGDRPGLCVLTPHPLEAGRLLGRGSAEVQADRIGAALALAADTGAIVVLKGAGTVIAAGDRYWVNTSGGPALATAGSGDVLAGMVGALLAQNVEPVQAVLAAVWLHGRAADVHGGDIGLVAGDIAALAAAELVRLRRTAAAGELG